MMRQELQVAKLVDLLLSVQVVQLNVNVTEQIETS